MAPSKNELIDNAQRYAQKGQLDKAIKEYQQALQLDSGDIQTRLRLGDVFVKKGATRDAIDQYFRVAERHSTDGFYLKAIAVHKQILKLDPNYIDSSSRLADLYHKQGLLSDALAAYQQVAAVYDKRGAVREALDTLTKMADLDPQNVAIRVKLGELYLRASIKESGIEQLLKAAELYGQAGKGAEQAKVIEKVLAAGPLNPASTRAVVGALLSAGQVDAALARVKALVAKAPDDPELRELQAQACLHAGKVDEAAEALAAAIEGSPQRVDTRRRLVEVRLEAGDVAGAAAAADGFTLDNVPPARLDAAARAAQALVEREPVPPDDVLAVLYRRLADLHGARKDAGAREAALAALAELGGAGGGIVVGADGEAGGANGFLSEEEPSDVPIDLATETTVDHLPSLAASPAPEPGAEPPAELTIEIDEAVEPAGGADLGGDVALEPPPPAPALDLAPAGPEPAGAMEFDLSLDFGGSLETAPLETDLPDGVAIDATPLDTPTVDAPGDAAPLEGGAARGRAASPESRVLAAGETELALDQIPEELDEAEFFEQQGLLEAARGIYRKILAVDPEHPVALERLERLREGTPAAPEAPAAPRGQKAPVAPAARAVRPAVAPPAAPAPLEGTEPEQFEEIEAEQFDLAAVLAGSSNGGAPALLDDPEEQVSFQEVFREFKKGVERQVGDDPETHYNLGIAYKEMGLIEDAIAEFERALGDPRRAFDCYTMIGLAHLGRGDADAAVAAFETGLGHADADPRQVTALTYELAVALEAAGRPAEARRAFASVAAADPGFRDAAEQLAALGGAPEPEPAADVFDPESLLQEAVPAAPRPAPADRARAGTPRGPAARDKISFV